MSLQTVEIKAFSGPTSVLIGGGNQPSVVYINQGPAGPAASDQPLPPSGVLVTGMLVDGQPIVLDCPIFSLNNDGRYSYGLRQYTEQDSYLYCDVEADYDYDVDSNTEIPNSLHWTIEYYVWVSGTLTVKFKFRSNTVVATPDLVATWTLVEKSANVTGTPVVTANKRFLGTSLEELLGGKPVSSAYDNGIFPLFEEEKARVRANIGVNLSSYVPFSGGVLDANATIEASTATVASTFSGDAFGVQLSGNPSENSSLQYGGLQVQNLSGTMSVTPAGLTFPNSSTQTIAFPGFNNTALTGSPTAPTPATSDNDTSIATTAYVKAQAFGDRYLTTSTTSNTVSNGNKTFTIGTGLSYTPTQNITISYDASNHMHGEVIAYNSGTGVLTVDINHHTGSGTYTAWVVNVGGVTPATSVAFADITGAVSGNANLQAQLDLKANLDSPALTGNVTITSNSANPALVITQDGAGDIVQFKDVTSDTTYSFINANGKVTTIPAVTTGAGFNIPNGVAPTSNLVNGDFWTTTAGVFTRINGNSIQIADVASGLTYSGNNIFAGPTLTFGNTTAASTVNIGTGATISGATRVINVGTQSATGSTNNINIGGGSGTTNVTLGGSINLSGPVSSGVNNISLGTGTAASVYAFGTGVTTTGLTKAISIGTNGASGSTTNITLGSATSGATNNVQVNGPMTVGNNFTATGLNINIGTLTATAFYNFGTGALASGATRTIGIGTNALAGSTNVITIGSTAGTSTTTLNGTTTIAGAATLSGATTVVGTAAFTNTARPTAPNVSGTAAPSSGSLITRNDALWEASENAFTQLVWNTPVGTANTSGLNSYGAVHVEGAISGGSAVAGNNYYYSLASNPFNRRGSGFNMKFNNVDQTPAQSYIFDLSSNGFSNTEIRLLFGVASAATQSLAAAGYGIVWTSETAGKLQIHNGTTLAEQSFTLPVGFNAFVIHKWMVTWDGVTLKLYNKYGPQGAALGRWSLLGSLAGTSLPSTCAGNVINLTHIATGTPVFNCSTYMKTALSSYNLITP